MREDISSAPVALPVDCQPPGLHRSPKGRAIGEWLHCFQKTGHCLPDPIPGNA